MATQGVDEDFRILENIFDGVSLASLIWAVLFANAEVLQQSEDNRYMPHRIYIHVYNTHIHKYTVGRDFESIERRCNHYTQHSVSNRHVNFMRVVVMDRIFCQEPEELMQVCCTTDDSHMWLAPFIKARSWHERGISRDSKNKENGIVTHWSYSPTDDSASVGSEALGC